jgi:hypothetical protein
MTKEEAKTKIVELNIAYPINHIYKHNTNDRTYILKSIDYAIVANQQHEILFSVQDYPINKINPTPFPVKTADFISLYTRINP